MIGDWLAVDILNRTLRAGPVWVSIHNLEPGGSGAGEITGDGYARQLGAFDEATVLDGAANADVIEFLSVGAQRITHLGVWDAKTGGHFLWGAPLPIPRTLQADDGFRIRPGILRFHVG